MVKTNLNMRRDTDLVLDLGYDSIKFIQLISEIEDMFHIEFEIEDLDLKKLRSIQFLSKLVDSKIGEKSNA